jgi:hypothetical protein
VALLVLFLMKTRRTPLYYTPHARGTRGNTYFNVALSSVLLASTLAVAAYTGGRLYRLRVKRRLPWADRGRAVAAAQRQARNEQNKHVHDAMHVRTCAECFASLALSTQVLIYAFLVDAIAYLAPNAYALARGCALFAPFVAWWRLVRWLALNVIFGDICLLALWSWWTARFPQDDIPEGASVASGGQGDEPLKQQPRRAGVAAAAADEAARTLPLAARAAPLGVVFCAGVGIAIALAIVAASDTRAEAPCADGPRFVADCAQHGLHLSTAHRWLMYAHACTVGTHTSMHAHTCVHACMHAHTSAHSRMHG